VCFAPVWAGRRFALTIGYVEVSATTPILTDDEVTARVAARMARQQRVLMRGEPPACWFLLDYFALIRQVGAP
jgi:hypothetical protein